MKEETKKTKKKFNKKYLAFGILGLFALALVSAIGYYALFSASFTVSPAITLDGKLEQSLGEVISGEVLLGTPITITNNAPSERIISITNDSDSNVEVSYVGTLELTKKTVDFGLEVWEIPENAEKVQIEYTVVGEEFNAKVIDNLKDGYVLIYYPDNDDRFVNPSEAWPIGVWELDSLPMEWDWNTGNYEGDYDYCITEEYDTCHGAKIWYVPESALTFNSETNAYGIDWSRASEFYFESSLIQYNAEGNIVMYPETSLVITPTYLVEDYAEGYYTITTTVA